MLSLSVPLAIERYPIRQKVTDCSHVPLACDHLRFLSGMWRSLFVASGTSTRWSFTADETNPPEHLHRGMHMYVDRIRCR